MDKARNRDRLAQIAHYVIARTPCDQLGRVKLNKALWIIDCLTWRDTGESLTGLHDYQRREFGPVPHGIRASLQRLQEAGKIVEARTDTPVGVRHEFMSLAEPDLSDLSAADVDRIHKAIEFVRLRSAREASDATHDAYWSELAEYASMKVSAGAIWPDEIDDDALAWAKAEVDSLGL